jgi:hypothetical protein
MLFPSASPYRCSPAEWGEAVEVHQRDAVDHGVADLDDSDQAAQGALVDLVLAQQFGVIQEIP